MPRARRPVDQTAVLPVERDAVSPSETDGLSPSEGMQAHRGPGLLVELDRRGEMPLHEQIERSLREAIRSGRLVAGTRLPSTRALSAELSISRGVVSEAYSQLSAEGYLTTRQGAPVRVAAAMRATGERAQARSLLKTAAYDFHPALPDLAGFPREAWLRSLRAAVRHSRLDALAYADPRGVPELREALARYLGRVRGADADPEHMLVCAGFMQGFSLVCRALRGRGVERVALEDPGWHPHRLVVEQAGMEVVPVPVDEQGLRVDLLEQTDASAVVVTAAHQFPGGAVLSSERRVALIEWAQEERLIIEDDYDAEYRYDNRTAVGALQGLASEQVVHIGSASKRLAPGIRLGWTLLPSWLTWELTSAKTIEDAGSESIGQLALADFIERGELDRHVRRMRLRYRRKRDVLLEAVARWLPHANPSDAQAGLFELLCLPDGFDEPAFTHAAATRGVAVEGLALHRFSADGPAGVLLGYGSLSEPAIEQGVRLLSDAFHQACG